ncbi:MAG: polysaccharide biosynthesis protein [Planctomyces sp.]|jgi:FlaA1/EpsC-like NDP-sugar epimerase
MTRLAIAVCCYAAMFAASLLLALMLRFDFELTDYARDVFAESAVIVVLLKIAIVLFFRDWRRHLRYSTIHDLAWSAGVCLAGGVLIAAMQTVNHSMPRIPRGVIAIDTVLAIGMLGGLRVLANKIRTWLTNRKGPRAEAALIYGHRSDAVSLLNAIQSGSARLRVVGIVSPKETADAGLIGGVQVFDVRAGLAGIIHRTGAAHVLLPSNLSGGSIRDVQTVCHEEGVEAHVVPTVDEIQERRFQLRMRDITIDDLLRREPNQLDLNGIRALVRNRVVMVTGAAGSIGSEVCRQLLQFEPRKIILLDQSEYGIFQIEQEFLAKTRTPDVSTPVLEYLIEDIADEVSMSRVFMVHRPSVVFHAAAYKHVPLMESNPQAAVRNNVFGTKNLVDLAHRFGVERFVMISTDKAVRPTNIMGATKLIAEQYMYSVAATSSTRFITVRFGNVLNSAGSVVQTFRRQIEEGGPVTVTDPEMQRYFMTIPEAVQLVLQSAVLGEGGDVLILNMGEPVRIVDLAKDMIRLSGQSYPHDIDIVYTGLRPGEKLYEELFYESEENACRIHEKIFRAPRQILSPSQQMLQELQLLKDHLNGSREELREVMWQVTTRFVKDHSSARTTVHSSRRAA